MLSVLQNENIKLLRIPLYDSLAVDFRESMVIISGVTPFVSSRSPSAMPCAWSWVPGPPCDAKKTQVKLMFYHSSKTEKLEHTQHNTNKPNQAEPSPARPSQAKPASQPTNKQNKTHTLTLVSVNLFPSGKR